MTFSYTLEQENRKMIVNEGSTEIPASAFSGFQVFDTVDLPSTVVTIGKAAFALSSLKEIDIPDSVTTIGWEAFYRTPISTVVIPDSVTDLAEDGFYESSLSEVVIGSGITEIKRADV